MGYVLEAIIASERVLKSQDWRYRNLKIVSLHQNLALIPITDELVTEIDAASVGSETAVSLPDFSNGFSPEKLSTPLVLVLKELSGSGPVMYCEAEYFGGSGGQLAIVWQNREIVLGPICTRSRQLDQPLNVQLDSERAINRALKRLGIEAALPRDEFDTVGLGKHRHTEQWC